MQTTPTTATTTTNTDKNATTPQKRKVLSGSTLNMKFMQRKKTIKSSDSLSNTNNTTTNTNTNNNNNNGDIKSPINTNGNTATITSSHQWTYMTTTNHDNNHNNNNTNKPNDESISTNTTKSPIVITAATMSDMYGTSTQIIGRRSFSKFHSAMERTYNTALIDINTSIRETEKNQSKKVVRNSCERERSDEELIQSYQDRFRQDKSHKKKRRN